MTRVILITGAPGVGKTTVAELLAARLSGTTARLGGDVFVLAVTPFEVSDDRRQFLLDNLASFIRHAIAHAYDWVVLECVIPCEAFIEELRESSGTPPACFLAVSVLADREAYERRLRRKTRHAGVSEASLQACHEWMERIRALTLPVPIDSSAQTPDQTAADVLRCLDRQNRR